MIATAPANTASRQGAKEPRKKTARRGAEPRSPFFILDFAPLVGSPRRAAEDWFWKQLAKIPCAICGVQPSEVEGWVRCREKPLAWVHEACSQRQHSEELALADDPWLTEESAIRLRLTIGQFKDLPSYERIRHNREQQRLRASVESVQSVSASPSSPISELRSPISDSSPFPASHTPNPHQET
jgi:hypothetical protein